MMRSVILYFILPILCGFLSMGFHPSKAHWQAPDPSEGEVTLAQTIEWSPQLLWIDARDSAVFESNHIPDAISLNHENFEDQLPVVLDNWQPGMRVVVYCDTQLCDASHSIADRLKQEVGLPDVWVLYGGWTAWKSSTH